MPLNITGNSRTNETILELVKKASNGKLYFTIDRLFICLSSSVLVSFAAVFWDVTQCSTQRNGCSHPNNIPFHCLANHSFRSIFENLVAQNSPFETCPIRVHFLFSHHTVGKSQINMATSARLEEAFHLASSKFKVAV